MSEERRKGVIVVGLGNEFRGDDGAGLKTARSLKSLDLSGVSVIELHNDVTSLPDLLCPFAVTIIIDAMNSGASPGSFQRFDLSRGPIPGKHAQRSTHGISLGSILEICRLQEVLPPMTIVYGIEGRSFDQGTGLSPEVEHAVNRLVDVVRRELERLTPVPV